MSSMDRVRIPRAPHVAVPAPQSAPLELSKEERHRLRVARHQAFQRHQQNAVWARELLDGHAPAAARSADNPRAFAARFLGLSREEIHQRLTDQEKELATLKSEVERADEQRERAERGSDDNMAALKQLNNLAAVAAARERLVAERATSAGPADRKLEIVRL